MLPFSAHSLSPLRATAATASAGARTAEKAAEANALETEPATPSRKASALRCAPRAKPKPVGLALALGAHVEEPPGSKATAAKRWKKTGGKPSTRPRSACELWRTGRAALKCAALAGTRLV